MEGKSDVVGGLPPSLGGRGLVERESSFSNISNRVMTAVVMAAPLGKGKSQKPTRGQK